MTRSRVSSGALGRAERSWPVVAPVRPPGGHPGLTFLDVVVTNMEWNDGVNKPEWRRAGRKRASGEGIPRTPHFMNAFRIASPAETMR